MFPVVDCLHVAASYTIHPCCTAALRMCVAWRNNKHHFTLQTHQPHVLLANQLPFKEAVPQGTCAVVPGELPNSPRTHKSRGPLPLEVKILGGCLESVRRKSHSRKTPSDPCTPYPLGTSASLVLDGLKRPPSSSLPWRPQTPFRTFWQS